jgi:hypothetical protein
MLVCIDSIAGPGWKQHILRGGWDARIWRRENAVKMKATELEKKGDLMVICL